MINLHGEVSLHSRLRNCLQTILELKEDMHGFPLDVIFVGEITLIRKFLGQIDDMALCEDDVLRIESATESLLHELSELFEKKEGRLPGGGSSRLQ